MSKQVTTTAKSGLIADNQYGKIYGSSPAGPTLKHFHLEVLFYFKGVFQKPFAGGGASKVKGLPFIDSGSTIDLA